MTNEDPTVRYVVITPARDEQEYIEATINSMKSQTIQPVEWVVVNDGSTDNTASILDAAAAESAWINVLHNPDRGRREAGSGVMQAFYAGLDSVATEDWDFLVKLDADLGFDSNYFENCFKHFAADPKLGIGGGIIFNRIGDKLVEEKHPVFHVRGATKIYRNQCWKDIGGLIRLPGWDTLDEVKANQQGWSTRSFTDVSLVQERFTGNAAGQWPNWVKNGRASYLTGYHPIYIIAKSFSRAFTRPYLKASFGLLFGYFKAMITREQRIDDEQLIQYLRRQQLRRLVGLSSIWR